MPAAPVRTPNKRAVSALPETSRLNFLLAASHLFAQTCPAASSQMGSQALKWADCKRLTLPRGAASQLCHQCGAHCRSETAYLVKTSPKKRQRRRQAQKGLQNKSSEHKVSAVCLCQVCGGSFVQPFVNEDAAHKMFPHAKLSLMPQHAPLPNIKANKMHAVPTAIRGPSQASQHADRVVESQQQPRQTHSPIAAVEHAPDNQRIDLGQAASAQQQGNPASEALQQPHCKHELQSHRVGSSGVAPHVIAAPMQHSLDSLQSRRILSLSMEASLSDPAAAACPMAASRAGSQGSTPALDHTRPQHVGALPEGAVTTALANNSGRGGDPLPTAGQAAKAEQMSHPGAVNSANNDQAISKHAPQCTAAQQAEHDGYCVELTSHIISGKLAGQADLQHAAEHRDVDHLAAPCVADTEVPSSPAAANGSIPHIDEIHVAGPACYVRLPDEAVLQRENTDGVSCEAAPPFISDDLLHPGAMQQTVSRRRMPFSWHRYGRTWKRLHSLN